jgi:hypothetical protein
VTDETPKSNKGKPDQGSPLENTREVEATIPIVPKPSRIRKILGMPAAILNRIKEADNNRVIAVATAIIAISACVQVGVAYFQYKEMQSGGNQTERIIKTANQIQCALETANKNFQIATVASNDLSRESVEAVQRAFVIWSGLSMGAPIVMKKSDKIEKYLDVDAVWENNGTTPATDAIYSYNVRKLLEEPNQELFLGDKNLVHETSYLGPKAKTSQTHRELLSFYIGDREITSTRKYAKGVFFWGWTVYRDVFPKTKMHLTEFCQEMDTFVGNVPSDTKTFFPPPVVNEYRMHYVGCKQHNCVDEYCKDYEEISNLLPKPN